jgi:N utilization substance protein B
MATPNIRREGREAALQFLFSHDLNEAVDPDAAEAFWTLRPTRDRTKRFALRHLRGIIAEIQVIDEALTAATENYRLERITPVDRNILRLATYELMFREDIPTAVTMNEAIEVAKRFGAEESPKFINGVLDRIRRECESSPPTEASGQAEPPDAAVEPETAPETTD